MLLIVSAAGAYTLEEAVETALSQRGDVEAARNEVESSRWDRNNAHTWFLPRVNATLGYQQDHDIYEFTIPGMGSIPMETEWASSYGITATIPIVAQGPAGASMTSTALDLAEHSLSAAEQDAVLDVVTSFYGVLLAEMMNEVATEAMDIAREGYELTSVRYETGMASRFELLQSQVAMENRRPDSIAAAAALENATAAFAVSMGYSESEPVTIEGDITDPFPVQLPSSLDEARSVMSSSSIELEMAESMRKLGDDGVNLAAASFAPQLVFQTEYNFEAQVDDIMDVTADDYQRNWTVSALCSSRKA
ncbi:MAG TPA: TolC family protein [Candidatus Sabulitectum sp.]|nr:TolC family protein [Candidatus Sabulitectum sp.]